MSALSPYHRIGLLIALICFALDQLSKYYFLEIVDLRQTAGPIAVTPFFNLVTVWNYGVSFGMFSQRGEDNRLILIAIAAVISLVLYVWLRRAESKRVAVALGLVIGGAVGNIIDRFRFGAVFDFIDLHVAGYHWPAFNVADSAICIGVLILCVDSFLSPPPPKQSA